MLRFFKQRPVIAQRADVIVGLICQEIPISQQGQLADARLKKRSAQMIRRVATLAHSAALEERPGVLGRAYLANRVRWALSARGYGDDFVTQITSSVVVAMHG